jgi:diguanylate cyclase
VISVLTNATGDNMEKGKVVVEHMVERAREMEQVKLELDEYKRIANTDPLTRLANRRAFDEVLANIYNEQRNAMYYALIVADIDHFKKFNDTLRPPGRRPGPRRGCGGDEKHAAQGRVHLAHRR